MNAKESIDICIQMWTIIEKYIKEDTDKGFESGDIHNYKLRVIKEGTIPNVYISQSCCSFCTLAYVMNGNSVDCSICPGLDIFTGGRFFEDLDHIERSCPCESCEESPYMHIAHPKYKNTDGDGHALLSYLLEHTQDFLKKLKELD